MTTIKFYYSKEREITKPDLFLNEDNDLEDFNPFGK